MARAFRILLSSFLCLVIAFFFSFDTRFDDSVGERDQSINFGGPGEGGRVNPIGQPAHIDTRPSRRPSTFNGDFEFASPDPQGQPRVQRTFNVSEEVPGGFPSTAPFAISVTGLHPRYRTIADVSGRTSGTVPGHATATWQLILS